MLQILQIFQILSWMEGDVMKDKIFIFVKIICQVLISIPEGWFFFGWFAYAIFFIIDREDQEAIEIGVPIGWTMIVIGGITLFSIEFIMYRRNKSWKNYFLFSLLPCISTALVTFLYTFLPYR